MYDMMIDISPDFTQYHPHYSMWPQGQGHGLRIFIICKFCVLKLLGPHYFQTMDEFCSYIV